MEDEKFIKETGNLTVVPLVDNDLIVIKCFHLENGFYKLNFNIFPFF